MSGYRLASGGRIDRERPLAFRFDGEDYGGYAGDTLASALLASGLRVFGRSFKFHRPRGLLSAGVEEPNALVEIGSGAAAEPNARATMVPLCNGLVARSQNAWPHRKFDIGRVFDWSHPLWPAGFYNKTFIWPGWRAWEGLIRRAAGLGRPLRAPDPDRYEHRNAHCDVLVIGSGPAGLAAALAAGSGGARVLLVEQQEDFGGSLLWEHGSIDGTPAAGWLVRILAELDRLPELRRLASTTAFGYYDHDVVALHQRRATGQPSRQPRACYWRVRARQVVLAAGAIEQPLVFAHNDRPGIMLAGAVRHYLNRYAVAAGRRAVIATNNDSAYRTALDLAAAGVVVQVLVDSRPDVDAELAGAVRAAGIAVQSGSVLCDTRGDQGLRAASIGRLSADRRHVAGTAHVDCDVLAMSGGWLPAVHLYSQARGALRFDAPLGAFVPAQCDARLRVAGAAAGRFSLHDAIETGLDAGEQAAAAAGFAPPRRRAVPVVERHAQHPPGEGPACSPAGRPARQWIDFQHDVTVADVALAVRENCTSVEHLKRYTGTGMSVDQGKTGNSNALAVLAELTGRGIAELGPTTFRPPYTPVTLGALAGRRVGERYRPIRRMPAHETHVALGAVFEEAGGWQRPVCYPRDGEAEAAAVDREVRAVRENVGLFEASPLGKIEVRGADAAEFLDRFYVNDMRDLPPGRVRYGLMLNEHGIIIDDGTVARLGEDRYLITTTSGGACRIADWLEEWRQCEWQHLNVLVTPVTTEWAVLTLAGPKAREVLQRLDTDVDLSAAAFPHMSVRSGRLGGAAARLCRVSFSGELSYEINVPAGCGAALWRRLMAAGAESGLMPYGLEALLLLRLEKGYLHVGIDTDGTTNPFDVGWGAALGKKRADFIGRRSLRLAEHCRDDRRQQVGLVCDAAERGADVLLPGAHLRLPGTERGSDGWITSAGRSATLGRPIALAMLRGGRARLGEHIAVHDAARGATATVVAPVFYDPDGVRLRG